MPLRSPTHQQIEAASAAACEAYNVDKSVLTSKSQSESSTYTRQLYWLLLDTQTDSSLRGIARSLPLKFGKSTVSSGIATANRVMEVDKDYRGVVKMAMDSYQRHLNK